MLNIAHRGSSGHAPENTLAAFRLAVEMGARCIETDLQLTRDARVVALHDATVDRTTNGRGRVSKMSLGELRRLDAGAWFLSPDGRSFKGERVPVLDEILSFAKGADVSLYLELKPAQMWGLEHALAGSLRKTGQLARTVVTSFDPDVLVSMRRAVPSAITGFITEQPTLASIEKSTAIGATQFLPRADRLTPEIIAAARRENLLVVAWTVNEIAEMRALFAMGVEGIMTDFPDRLTAVLEE